MFETGTITVIEFTRFFMCAGLNNRGPSTSPNIWNIQVTWSFWTS